MENTNEGYLAEKHNKDNSNIVDYIRAVIESYMRKYENNIKTGFETVILDRIVKWKEHQKRKKSVHFTFFLFISFISFFVLTYFNFFLNIDRFYIIVFIASLMGLILSIIDIVYIRGQIPIKTHRELIGFKKAISDLYYETFRSTQIVYFKYLLFFLVLYSVGFYYSEYFIYIDKVLFKLFSKIVSEAIILPQFKYIFNYWIFSNIAFIIFDFIFIFIYAYFIPKKDFI